jgi:hypothetical protein
MEPNSLARDTFSALSAVYSEKQRQIIGKFVIFTIESTIWPLNVAINSKNMQIRVDG